MGRITSLIASLVAILLPLFVSYALRPTPDQNRHAMMWLILTAGALGISALLSGFAIYFGYGRFVALPVPRPAVCKFEFALLLLPPVLFLAIVGWRVLSSGT